MKDFWIKFSYLLDRDDRKNFITFLLLLFFSGILSLLGIGAIIPFIHILLDPEYIKHLLVVKQLHLEYQQLLGILIGLLILSFWIKNISAFIILKKQAAFLGKLIAKIQKKLFFSYLHSPYVEHIKRQSSELINNINVEIGVLSNNVIVQLGTLLNEGITSSIIVIALLFINPIFSLIVVTAMFITAYFFIRKIRHKLGYYGNIRSQSETKLTQSIIQGLGGIKETKIYQKEGFFIENANRYADNIAQADTFAAVFQQCPRFLVETILVTVVLGLMFAFIKFGYSAVQLLVLISVFGIAAIQLLPSTNRFLQALANIKYGQVALDKIYHELNRYAAFAATLTDTNNSSAPLTDIIFSNAVHLKNIYFEYDGKKILQNISLTIPKGKKIALVGSSGAGKSTLLNIILGILAPSQGELSVDGVIITPHNLSRWYSHFGYIPEMIYIYDSSLKENVAFGLDLKEIDEAKVWRCLEMVSLSEFVMENSPCGLDMLVGENGINLSAGQRQRVAIARALYHDPVILVMDEATAALDNQTEHAVIRALAKAGQGRTIISIAHRLSTIMDYDIIHMMDAGKIIASGTYEYLLAHCAPFQKMVDVKKTNI